MTLHGGMRTDEREKMKAAFQVGPDDSDVWILLATDAASEGIDIQNHCNRLIHYEIPWNPNRMEQRNDRIDRHGQRADEVLIYHSVGSGYADRDRRRFEMPLGDLEGDLEFLMRAARKVQAIREDLVPRVPDVGSHGIVGCLCGGPSASPHGRCPADRVRPRSHQGCEGQATGRCGSRPPEPPSRTDEFATAQGGGVVAGRQQAAPPHHGTGSA